MKKSIGSLTILALAAGLLVTAMAPAFASGDQTATAETTTTIAYRPRTDKMVGRVASTRNACVPERRVKVYKITRKGRVPVGSATTNDEGRWRLPLADAQGRYGARAVRKTITLDSGSNAYGDLWKHVLECKSGRSAPLKV